MPENINLKLSANGDSSMPSKQPLTLGKAIDKIKQKGYPGKIEAALIKTVSAMPSQTYEKFLEEIGRYIAKLNKKKD